MAIGLKLADGITSAMQKVLSPGPNLSQVAQGRQLMAESREALDAAHADTVRNITGREPVDLLEGNLAPDREQGRAAMHAALDSIIDRLEQDASFMGFQIDEHVLADGSGKVSHIVLVPVDFVSGTPARRIEQPE